METADTTRKRGLSGRLAGDDIKRPVLAGLAFLILIAVLFTTKTMSDYRQHNSAVIETFTTDLTARARSVSRTIDAQTAVMSLALSVTRDPSLIAPLARQNDAVRGIAVLNGQNQILAETDGAGPALAQIDLAGIGDGQTRIASLIQPETGETTPVIVQRAQDLYLLAALNPGALIGTRNPETALVLSNGRIIDAPPAIGRAGAYSHFELTPANMARFAQLDQPELLQTRAGEVPVWLGAVPVPKSGGSMLLLDRQDRSMPGFLAQNIIMFGLLVAGILWLGWMLISRLSSQLKIMRTQNMEEEIARQRFRAAMDGSGGGIWEIDLSRNTAFVSASLAKLIGMEECDATISLPQFLGLFEPADRDRLYNTIRRAHVTGAFDLDLALAQLPLFVSCRGVPSTRGSDRAKVIIGMALDVTEARGTQVRLKAAEARLFDALRSMNDSFVIWDQMDRLVLWNRKFEDFFGFQNGNLQVGMDYAVVEHYSNQVVETVQELADGTGREIKLNDGRWLRYLETETVDGGRVSIGTDVTAIRSRESELEANRDRLQSTINILRESQTRIVELAENYEQEKIRAEEASQSKSEFLANMSHELRTPLNAINGFSDIMKKEMFGPLGDPRYREYIADILFSGQHLLSLINDILDMSKIEAGKMTLNVETLSISDMITQVMRIVRGRADENRLKLIHEDIDAHDIQADPRAVKQVLLNLATNAIKFTPEGGTVTITVDAKATGVIIHVTDTGIGISEEDIARLAQPFEQIDSQHSRQHEGTGLGLALSKSLVELHGGNFSIASKLGEGTTVTFTLPNEPIVKEAVTEDREVGDEITRLAQDIANVLGQGDTAPAAPLPQPAMNPPMDPAAPAQQPISSAPV
ncbi:non-motile and phage-resistance protein [Algimonas porphyrae]|uniref:histidine kinase n=1 Tax=Algimonas porphyrae TaxID=1128113 RepID=A0ABQ5UYY2_9PROT|nr:non-motile and phage-resistance protein [Algimonas porphyrae]